MGKQYVECVQHTDHDAHGMKIIRGILWDFPSKPYYSTEQSTDMILVHRDGPKLC